MTMADDLREKSHEGLVASVEARQSQRDASVGENEKLRQIVRRLQRRRYAQSSEKLDDDQLNLLLENLNQNVAAHELHAVRNAARAPQARRMTCAASARGPSSRPYIPGSSSSSLRSLARASSRRPCATRSPAGRGSPPCTPAAGKARVTRRRPDRTRQQRRRAHVTSHAPGPEGRPIRRRGQREPPLGHRGLADPLGGHEVAR